MRKCPKGKKWSSKKGTCVFKKNYEKKYVKEESKSFLKSVKQMGLPKDEKKAIFKQEKHLQKNLRK